MRNASRIYHKIGEWNFMFYQNRVIYTTYMLGVNGALEATPGHLDGLHLPLQSFFINVSK